MEKTEKTLRYAFVGLFIILIGGACNFLAIQENGKMPILDNERFIPFESSKHFIFYSFDEVSYPYLSDIFLIGFENWGYTFSVGDVFLTLGGFLCGFFGAKYIYLTR